MIENRGKGRGSSRRLYVKKNDVEYRERILKDIEKILLWIRKNGEDHYIIGLICG